MPAAVNLSTARRVGVVVVIALALLAVMLRQDTRTPAAGGAAPPISGLCVGAKQGTIKGESTVKGREGTYNISAASHGITTPRDSASGQPTGRRQHKPVTITMELGKSAPKLINALTTNELLKSCTFNFWETSSQGKEKNYFRVAIKNAVVSDYTLTGRPGGADTVTFSFTYQQITWTYLDGGITASDDWESPSD